MCFPYLSDQNLSCCNLSLLTFILLLCTSEESSLHLPIRYLQTAVKSCPESSLLHAEQFQLSQPTLACHAPASARSDCMLLDSIQHANDFFVLGKLQLDLVLEMQSNNCWIEGKNPFSWLLACAFPNTALFAALPHGYACWLSVHEDLQVLFCKAGF